jgi:hypothetical protein
VDCDQFRKENLLPLYPGKVNRWLLARSDEGSYLSEDLVRADCKSMLERVLKEQLDNIVIKLATQNGQPVLAPPVVKRRDELTALPILSGKKPWYVSVEFAYRGEAESMGWLAEGETFSCDLTQLLWTVLAVGAPLVDAPPEETILTDLSHAGTAVGEVLDKSTTKLLVGGALVAAILYLWKK